MKCHEKWYVMLSCCGFNSIEILFENRVSHRRVFMKIETAQCMFPYVVDDTFSAFSVSPNAY